MNVYLVNAFSFNMLPANEVGWSLRSQERTTAEARRLSAGAVSGVGHGDMATLFAAVLGREVELCRSTLTLAADDSLLLGQYSGSRLPPGTTELPAGAQIRWIWIDIYAGAAVDPDPVG